MRERSHAIVRNSAFGLFAQIAIKLLSFTFTVVVVRALGEAAFGQYATVLAFGGIFAFVADLGLSPYAVREIARRHDTAEGSDQINQLYGNVVRLRLALSVLAGILLIGTVWFLGKPLVFVGAIALSWLGLVMYSVQGSAEAVLAGYERMDVTAVARVLWQVTFVGVGSAALIFHAGYPGLIVANLLGIALMTATCWRGVKTLGVRSVRANRSVWPALLRASMPFGIIGFTLSLSYKFDTILLSQFWGDVHTGYYNVAYSLVFATVVLSNIINTALYPSLSRLATTDPKALGGIYAHALKYLIVVSLPVAVGGSMLAAQIVPFVYGPTFAPAIGALQIIIWTVPLMFISEFLGYVVLIQGKERQAAQAVLMSTAFNVAANLALVPLYGVQAAAAMTVLTEAVLVAQYVWRLRTDLRVIPFDIVLLRPLLCTLGMALAVSQIHTSLPVLASVAVGAVTYALLLFVLKVIQPDELRFVRSVGVREKGLAR